MFSRIISCDKYCATFVQYHRGLLLLVCSPGLKIFAKPPSLFSYLLHLPPFCFVYFSPSPPSPFVYVVRYFLFNTCRSHLRGVGGFGGGGLIQLSKEFYLNYPLLIIKWSLFQAKRSTKVHAPPYFSELFYKKGNT